jgi:uncharacterized hydrophobic protein (TIGR00341 family)
MQIIQVFLRSGESEDAKPILRDLGITEYSIIRSTTGDLIVIEHPLDKIDKLLQQIQKEFNFRDSDDRTIIIQSADAVLPRKHLKEELFESHSSKEEVLDFAEDNSHVTQKFMVMMALASIVATFGMLADNVAVVVGAMIIAPAFGPLAGASIGISMGRKDIFKKGLKAELIGVSIAIATAAALALLVPGIEVNSLLRLRMYPGIPDLLVALAVGAAGAYTLTKAKGSYIVGVMVAAALVPTMAAVGIGFVLTNPLLVFGSLLLLLINIVSIILAMVLVFWFMGTSKRRDGPYRTYNSTDVNIKRVLKYSAVVIILMLIPLLWITNENYVAQAPEVEISKIFEDNVLHERLELAGMEVYDNIIHVSVYSLVDDPSVELGMLKEMIERRIDPRYSLVFNVVKAERV